MTDGQSSGQSRRQRERDRRRNEIIDAAGRVFAKRGYSDTTMDAVAAEAELSKGTLYLYFQNKEALFLANASRMAARVLAEFQAISADPAATGLDCYRRMLEGQARIAVEHPEKFRALIGFIASNTELDLEAPTTVEHRRIIEQIIDCKVAALERGMTDGSVRRDINPIETSAQTWGAMLGINLMTVNFAELKRRFPRPIEPGALAPGFIELLISGLRNPE